MATTKYRCPACNFQIFNRRVPKCESCGAALPAELLFSNEQAAALDADYEKSKKEREARARADGSLSGDAGGADFGDWDVL